MKIFKKLATIAMALSLCLGAGAALVACGGKGGDTSSTGNSVTSEAPAELKPIENGYTFKVLNADGTPAVGYKVQLCDTNGCKNSSTTDANGVATITDAVVSAGEYEMHLLLWSDTSVKPDFDATCNGAALERADKDGVATTVYPVTPAQFNVIIEIKIK